MSSTTIDDQDFSHVKYTGTWIRGGSGNEHDGTVASSTNVGDFLTLKFTGNSIAVYGTIDSTSNGVLTNYSIDGSAPEQVTSQAGTGDTFNQQFWKSPILSVGEHNLVVTMAKINTNAGPGEGTVWFDYFLAVDPTIRPGAAAHRKHIGAIVGGVVGGVFAVLLAVLALVFLRRRQRKKQEAVHVQPIFWPKNGIDSDSPSPFNVGHLTASETTVEPFFLGSSQSQGPSSSSDSGTLPRKSAILNDSRRQISISTAIDAQSPPPSSIPASSTSQGNIGSSPHPERPQNALGKHQVGPGLHERDGSNSYLPPSPQPLQHVDSGVRALNVETGGIPAARVELPPVYSPV